MDSQKLGSLVVHVPGRYKSDPLEQARETLRITTEVANEIRRATYKCQSITEIDDQPASVVRLRMTGKNSVETIRLTYISNGITLERDFPKKDFYNL